MASNMSWSPLRHMKDLCTLERHLKCGFVVSHDMLFIGSSPDGRVVDFGYQNNFGLSEVKCPEIEFHVSPLDACQEPNFFL